MPENIIGEAAIALRANFQEFQEDLGKVQKEVEKAVTPIKKHFESIGDSLKHVGDKMSDVGKNMSLKVTAPIVAAGAASMKAWADVDNAMDTIITKTGAMGDKAAELEQAFKNVATTLPADMQTVAEAIGEVNTQFGLVGENLEDATRELVQFATLNEVDVSSATLNAKRAIEVFGLTAKDVGEVLDSVNYVAQSTGIAVDQIFEAAVRGAPQIKALGLSFGEGALLMGKFEQAGLDSRKALSYLARAQVEFAKDGKTLQEGLAELQKKLLSSKDSTEALTLASTYFGTKGATIMLDAIQRGVLDLGDLAAAAEQAGGSVALTFEGTLDPIDQMKVLMNNLKLALAEVGTSLQTVLEPALNKVIEAVQKFADWFNNLSPAAKNLIVTIGLLAAALGPLLLIIGQIISVVGTLTSFLPVLGGAFTLLTGPIGLVVAAVAGAIAIGVALWKNWDEVKAFITNIWNSIADTAKSIWTGIASFLGNTWNTIQGVATTVWTAISTFFTTIWNSIKSTTTAIWNSIASFLVTIWNNIKTTATSVWNAISNFFSTTWNTIKSIATTVWNSIASTLSGIWNNINNTASTIWNSIKNTITSLFNSAKDSVTSTANSIHSSVSSVWNRMVSTISSVGSRIWNAIVEPFNIAKQKVLSIVSDAYNWGRNLVQNVIDGITSMISRVADAAKSVASTIWSFLGFHSPTKEGPGSDADKWMPNLMNMLNEGIQRNIPKLQATLNMALATPMIESPTITAMTIESHEPATIVERERPAMRPVEVHLHIGTLVADDYGLKQLERKLASIRISENMRLGVERA